MFCSCSWKWLQTFPFCFPSLLYHKLQDLFFVGDRVQILFPHCCFKWGLISIEHQFSIDSLQGALDFNWGCLNFLSRNVTFSSEDVKVMRFFLTPEYNVTRIFRRILLSFYGWLSAGLIDVETSKKRKDARITRENFDAKLIRCSQLISNLQGKGI